MKLTKGKYLVVKHNGQLKRVKMIDKGDAVIFPATGSEVMEKTLSKLTKDEKDKLK
jgi:hypothetical protein